MCFAVGERAKQTLYYWISDSLISLICFNVGIPNRRSHPVGFTTEAAKLIFSFFLFFQYYIVET